MYRVLTATRSLLLFASKYKKPSDSDFAHLCAEPLVFVSQITDMKAKPKERYSSLHQLLASATPAFACLFVCTQLPVHTSPFTEQRFFPTGHGQEVCRRVCRKKQGVPATDELYLQPRNVQAYNLFVETLDTLVAAIETYMDDKHFSKSGLIWSGTADFDSGLKLFSGTHGHQVSLLLNGAKCSRLFYLCLPLLPRVLERFYKDLSTGIVIFGALREGQYWWT